MTAIKETYVPGPFGDRPMQTMSVRQHTLARIEHQLEDALVDLEHLGERGICDNLSELIGDVVSAKVAEQDDDKESAA